MAVDEETAMLRAVALSRLSLGETSPNPNVGCVILDASGEIVGEGRTAPAGGPHAEVRALAEAGDRARGGTAIVTLEPCDHTGRTGPCTAALLAAGVRRVVYAVSDPDPVAAGGAVTLRAAGVEVVSGVLESRARSTMQPWLTAVGRGRPFIVWKFAATLDGRSAAADGTSQWITSPQARADVHDLRAEVDAIIVGAGTVRADDPQLTARFPDGSPRPRQPLRVVLAGSRDTPEKARVTDAAAPTWVVEPGPGGRVDLDDLVKDLYARGVRYALLEGGPTLAGSFLAAGLVDRVVGYLAPALLGAGPAALGDAGISTIGDALRLDVLDVTMIGPDIRLTAAIKPTSQIPTAAAVTPAAQVPTAAVTPAAQIPTAAVEPAARGASAYKGE
jgi:diaminohydroxyphosphoribosylaminopyrimidine deaminase/5-amino-6-(5-phosphoribosylamino)uracil reductase